MIARTRTLARRKPLLSGTLWYGLVIARTGFELRTHNPQFLGASLRGAARTTKLQVGGLVSGRRCPEMSTRAGSSLREDPGIDDREEAVPSRINAA